MPKTYFKFKQFTIQQQNCAMKVCTDTCLFGALVVARFSILKMPLVNCLDIGTGTGLLSLMLAQKNPTAKIDAVEIDEQAAMQATSNFQSSIWNERLKVHHVAIQHLATTVKYNLIVCNPPFFENDLKSDDGKRNIALHGVALNLEELIVSVKKNITADGMFAVMLPYHRSSHFITLACENSFFLLEKIVVTQTPEHPFFRSILFFLMQPTLLIEMELTIKNKKNEYTPEFVALLKDYYLYL